jgi:hypothetical protein
MYYLYEHQLGYHSLALGYPSIDGCNAICLQTNVGLLGLHVYGCDRPNTQNRAMENETKAFAAFVLNHPQGRGFVHLYSVCFHGKRGYGNNRDGWKNELKMYADELGYKGKVSGFDLSTVTNWPNVPNTTSSDSAYVEFRRVFDSIGILYKPWHQCVHPAEIKASSIADHVNYRSVDAKDRATVSDKFWFDKALTSLKTDGSGFVVAPESLRLTFTVK